MVNVDSRLVCGAASLGLSTVAFLLVFVAALVSNLAPWLLLAPLSMLQYVRRELVCVRADVWNGSRQWPEPGPIRRRALATCGRDYGLIATDADTLSSGDPLGIPVLASVSP